ncbi:hypothetical protein D9619_001891 [Psilocybe cf. subviscida]|uniref:Uncharacterized protein n=1 Tax=Psilocybe cf. subviscida TaxID=2480587 RepID=A0A8H5F2A6_9AGAR|nr:hypothetical protein D9619_001891 [Psilocybe cf. subviscida]
MDGSDDYFFDDIAFDDQTLAILDQQEKKHQVQAQQKPPSNATTTPAPRVAPVPKRQKTHTGWTPGGATPSSSRTTEDDLPEISLHGDGSYAIGHRAPISQATVQRRAPQVTVPPVHIPKIHASRTPAGRTPTPSTSHSTYANAPRLQNARVQNNHATPPAQAPAQVSAQIPEQTKLEQQVAELQKKLDELSRDHSKVQASLKKEYDIRLAKEGETALNHATQISLLRSEKEQADSKQAQLQKEMKDEVERLRTQFLFRQQELEMATRKAPGSVRPKKPAREFPSTPLPVPNAMASWNPGAASSSKMRMDETPVRPSRLPPTFKSPTKQTRKSPEKAKKNFMLPGFENAFETSTPMRSPSRRPDKGKAKMFAEPEPVPLPSQIFRPLSQISQGHTQPRNDAVFNTQRQLDMFAPAMSLESRAETQSQVKDEDIEMTPPESSDEDPFMDEQEPFDPINWKSELCRIILTHVHLAEGRIAFQHLISSDPGNTQDDAYSNSCMKIMEVIASPIKSEEYEDSARVVAESLITLLLELSNSQQLLSLSVLFNLLSYLVTSLPNFSSTLLLCRVRSRERLDMSLMDLMAKVIAECWGTKANSEEWHQFATEVVLLLQALCFYQQEDTTGEIERFVRDHRSLLTILSTSQPLRLLESSTCLLMLLSTHHSMYKAFLKLSPEESKSDPPRFLLIERLCSLLMDTSSPPVENAKIHILMYFAQLAMAHPDAHAALGSSPVLIPSLIMYISQLTTPIWEDDGTLASSPDLTASYVQTLNQTLFLLYQIVYAVDPVINLRYKLQHASTRQFNSIKHIFIVTFGRMSYCDPPSWVEPIQRPELEYLAEVARDVLELMVDGPEGDSVWAAFQAEPDEEGGVDEGEMEAQFIS